MKIITIILTIFIWHTAQAGERNPALTFSLVNYIMGVGDSKTVKDTSVVGHLKQMLKSENSSSDSSRTGVEFLGRCFLD